MYVSIYIVPHPQTACLLLIYRICGTFGVILIWRFGKFSSDHQIKITANTVVLSQVLINRNDEMSLSVKLNICQSVFLPKPPNLMSAKYTTHTVCVQIMT